MIKVFSGAWRGLGEQESGLFLMMEFRFRNILHLFHGAKLAVFMCLVLHSDKEGHSFPSYELMEKETGYNRSSINRALDELCKLKIDGNRVLLRYRDRDDDGHLVGSRVNHYLIFPTPEEVTRLEPPKTPVKRELQNANDEGSRQLQNANDEIAPQLQNANLQNANLQNATISINQSLSVNQSLSKTCGADAPRRSDVEKKGDAVDGTLAFLKKDPLLDVSGYPEDVRVTLTEVYTLWRLVPPVDRTKALWIREARELQAACGEFGLTLLHRYFDKWKAAPLKDRLTISRPGSLTKLIMAEAGLARQEQVTRSNPMAGGYDPERMAAFQTGLKKIREEQNANAQERA